MRKSTHADDQPRENAALSSDVPFPVSTHNKKGTPTHIKHWQSQWYTICDSLFSDIPPKNN
jgi:hypothetical protein